MPNRLHQKHILLGVTGGIAAYKAAALCSGLVKTGAQIHVIMTESATRFISPLTFQAISRNKVVIDTFEEQDAASIAHIDLADQADLVIIAPATANMIGKMANGLSDDMLSTTLLATTAPVWVAPAMNVHMYTHPAVQENMARLENRGVFFLEPGEGPLACGYNGKGRMMEPEQIIEEVNRFFNMSSKSHPLTGKRLIVTAGGTRERIDPVRYIGNDSSGKMGYALAKAGLNCGMHVTLISGPTGLPVPDGVHHVAIESAQEMLDVVMQHCDEADVLIKAAAVADYRPVEVFSQKLKKDSTSLTIELERTTDILKTIGERQKRPFLVGFAAETEQLVSHAKKKLETKNCDMVIANDVSQANSGFGSDTNKITLLDRSGAIEEWPVLPKDEVAARLMDVIGERWDAI